MKIDIPFYASEPTVENPEGIHCVENSLQMVLGYFEPQTEYSLQDMERITDKQPEKATWAMAWSIWFVDHGYTVRHFSTFDFQAFSLRGADYIREAYGPEIAKWQEENSDLSQAQHQTKQYLQEVEVIAKHPTVQDIEEIFDETNLIRASVNQKTLNGHQGYTGHSVVITGIDKENIWFHDPGLPAYEDKKVSRELFQQAMDSFGGEMDVIHKP